MTTKVPLAWGDINCKNGYHIKYMIKYSKNYYKCKFCGIELKKNYINKIPPGLENVKEEK